MAVILTDLYNYHKNEVIEQIVSFLNNKYPEVEVIYRLDSFYISGEGEQMEFCQADILDLINFGRVK